MKKPDIFLCPATHFLIVSKVAAQASLPSVNRRRQATRLPWLRLGILSGTDGPLLGSIVSSRSDRAFIGTFRLLSRFSEGPTGVPVQSKSL